MREGGGMAAGRYSGIANLADASTSGALSRLGAGKVLRGSDFAQKIVDLRLESFAVLAEISGGGENFARSFSGTLRRITDSRDVGGHAGGSYRCLCDIA